MVEDFLYMFKGRVLKVIDGDTVDVELDFGFDVKAKRRLRLLGVDTPERGEENWSTATEFTRNMIDQKDVIIQTHKSDVFGRYLAQIWYFDREIYKSLNVELANSGLLKPNSEWNSL